MLDFSKLKAPLPPSFFWTLLFFLCLFGFTAWLLQVNAGAEIAGVLSLAVSVVALIASPSDSRPAVWGALASAFVLVVLGTLGYLIYDNLRSVDVTADVRFEGAQQNSPVLMNSQRTTFTIPVTEPRDHLTISFRITDAPDSEAVQDCGTDTFTSVELALGGNPDAIRLESGEERTLPVRGDPDIRGAVTMNALVDCQMQLQVARAELHN
ncbi:hypothetical protein SAMN05421805_11587 [Saccharopolyspora antimicrobica]|uniref:Uncharacterized protein n=1 Tax=Saccharopolyspora antimicrobica TaxID=455193 RepID=A0A1I5HF86_9PSEU|nr:hypothetical protein ATL45_3675 [Saccharopolyspora antimicrobica]SFO46720.1 hypothetical protein SAMN05421805_11587 [Saccharopolyspora antimicrobica]